VEQAVAHFGAIDSVHVFLEKKFAFVNFFDASSAAAAMAAAQSITVLGSAVELGWAKSREERAGGAIQGSYGGNPTMGSASGGCRSIHIGNIVADNFTKEDVEQAVAHFGPIDSVHVFPDKKYAFVNFFDASSAAAAMAAAQSITLGGPVRVGWAKSREERAGQATGGGNSSFANSNGLAGPLAGMVMNGMMGNGMMGMGNAGMMGMGNAGMMGMGNAGINLQDAILQIRDRLL